jgi:hypothetical protein
MTPPNNHKFIEDFLYSLGVSFFQKLYTNLTLISNVFKLNQEQKFEFKN